MGGGGGVRAGPSFAEEQSRTEQSKAKQSKAKQSKELTVGHAEEAGAGVLNLEVLIGELAAVDGLSTHAVAVSEISALVRERESEREKEREKERDESELCKN